MRIKRQKPLKDSDNGYTVPRAFADEVVKLAPRLKINKSKNNLHIVLPILSILYAVLFSLAIFCFVYLNRFSPYANYLGYALIMFKTAVFFYALHLIDKRL